ncbi:MAG: sulfurtransferase TusA family protein [Candidatus Omnitrophota bacterium]
MDNYQLPKNLNEEIAQLETLLDRYKNGEISAVELKARRVPFGVYEQREPDTYMVRIRCAAGIITPTQLEAVAQIAKTFGIDALHITTRQELQMHYVRLSDIVVIIKRLKEAGLATRGGGGNTVRNIIAQEDAGIDPKEEFDVTPYALALTTRLIAEEDSWNLPRKFKIAFSGSQEDKGYATLADLGFIARIKNGKPGFKVYVAGGLGAKSDIAKPLLDFINSDEVYVVARAVKNIFFKYGNRRNKHAARLRFLWQSLGEEEFKRRFADEYAAVKKQGFPAFKIREPKNEVIVPDLPSEEPQDAQDFILWKSRFVRPQKTSGLFSVTLPVKLGFINYAQMIKLAQFLKPFGEDVLRMSREQNILLRNIPSGYLAKVYNFSKDTWEDFNHPLILSRIISCAGASTCQLGICLSRQAAKALIDTLKESELDLDKLRDIKINISGCPNSCGQHPAADIGFFGKAARKDGRMYPAYNVVAGAVIRNGRTKLAEPIGEVAAKDLPALVKDFLQAGEDLKPLLRRYQNIPSFEQDKNYYFDWGADKLFSLAERRSGECSAGIYDLLETDLNRIKNTQAAITKTQDRQQKAELLKELVFYASRALLITRGVDAKSDEEVYKGFLEHFIDAGLIASSFRPIVLATQQGNSEALLAVASQADALAKAVAALYETMDNAFNFNPAMATPESREKDTAASIVKDFRGVVCPLNFAKTKIELAKLKSGELLEIWLDDGEPIENVPGSVKSEGHQVISQKKIADYWSVVIRKK